ncbi:ArsR/SmtB family transcription factor [Flavihumibacter petaseus]|uniref:Putative ArsR family transcriptional regulator n=1 Tax=Flavihumibacter petaseus NBRC 106054 TaxID=1220578 RepID=A0A0E9MUM2_9BACT|nr:metalloregulator ArsR/SmtB family transcription factor [Flavihumibacter petaseus]GAO41437.1 putative ArsR family transcriptional regulator [Flavihumibacter petaseus NBRC 106054]
MEARRDVFQAIADPTRREILDLLSGQPLNVNTVAERFDMTRQAVSLHVKILSECGLIVLRQQGRERICEAQLDKLREVAQWVERYRQFWEQHLDSLEQYLDHLQKQKKHGRKK